MVTERNPTSRDPLEALFADAELGPARKLAFYCLWRFAGSQPGEVVVTTGWLGQACGRDARSAWDWLQQLQRRDLILIGARNKRRGSWSITVYHPCPGCREPTPDAQGRLPLDHAGGGATRDESPPEPTPAADCADGNRRGGFRTETPAPPNLRGGSCARTPAQNVVPAHAGGEKSAPSPGNEGNSPPLPATYENPRALRRGGFCAKTPAPFGTKEPKQESSNLPRCQSLKETKVPKYQSSNVCTEDLGAGPLAVGALAAVAILERRALDDQPRIKERLVQRIEATVGRGLARWVSGSAANLVVYQGVPIDELDRVLGDVQAMREAGGLRNAASFFHAKARELAAQYSARWPRGRNARDA